MKKRNSSLLEESSRKLLMTEPPLITTVTSSPDTSEKIILKGTNSVVNHIRQWSIDKVNDVESIGDKAAIYEEFEEWIELDEDGECDIVSVDFNIADN